MDGLNRAPVGRGVEPVDGRARGVVVGELAVEKVGQLARLVEACRASDLALVLRTRRTVRRQGHIARDARKRRRATQVPDAVGVLSAIKTGSCKASETHANDVDGLEHAGSGGLVA